VNVFTSTRFGAALRQKYSRSANTHRAVVDTLTDQLWSSAVDAATCQLSERLAGISSLTVTEASQRISQWLSNLSRSTSITVLYTVKFVEQSRSHEGLGTGGFLPEKILTVLSAISLYD